MKRLAAAVVLVGLCMGLNHAEPSVVRTVNCVYPGEQLGAALGDLASQLGYAFVPGEMQDGAELEEPIWVRASAITPALAAELIGASGGVRVTVSDSTREVLVAEHEESAPLLGSVRAYRVGSQCDRFVAYQKRFGLPLDTEADAVPRPTAAQELRDAVAEILQLEGAPGTALGKRLIYTRTETEHERIAELLALIVAPGESSALRTDREQRKQLASQKSEFPGGERLVSAVLWQIFKDTTMPVYIEHAYLESLDLESDTTLAPAAGVHDHYEALLALSRECGFWVDNRHGAMRLHDDSFAGAAAYRVFDVSDFLVELEKEYAELHAEGSNDGFDGNLRSEGGVQVVVETLSVQLENAGYSPLIRAYGSRVAVVGGVEIIDRAKEILEAAGWTEPAKENGK